MVNENVTHFMREFLIAIIAVIIVIMLLLPLRVAAVAATAIPMTIATTIALMHTFGIELHQVSLISLIVVLGMVVDDAIVVTDNYVDLLDKGVSRWTAAWRSASDLVVPILTATLTIIASFMPMIILKGAIGEFVHDLPITVSLALTSSFIVAMVLTPILCLFFIKKGIHPHPENGNGGDAEKKESKKSFGLDLLQKVYNKTIDWGADHKTLVIVCSMLFIVFAVLLFKFGIRQRFMPYAERNQFIVELWMPTGTKLETTQCATAKIENEIKDDKRLVSYATFTGTSAPRVYYSFSPEFPVTNYSQILINTLDIKSTETFAHDLSKKIDALVPEGMAQVRLMQQGQPLIAPVEVRISGDNIQKLREIGEQVKAILKSKPGSYLVHDDFHEDFYGVNIKLKENAARLGFTTSSVSQIVYTGFKGYAVSSMYEGDKSVDIVLRMDSVKRESLQDLENIYVESPVTGASIPLRQIAEISPDWQTGRIKHRNGVRSLSILSETKDNVLPSELLDEIRPEIARLNLPVGYSIEYGGEYANQNEVMAPMFIALFISLVLIFLILLFQFKTLKEVFIIILTIPLSLLGAVFGLYVTGNYFGLTAFMGIVSLSGIVVRNAIILIDHTNELIRDHGMDIRTAAIESGKRRLRPVFLTAMAAAVGVFPMILSGSSLWSPMASVIAFGVTWSMIVALLTVPVLYIVIVKPKDVVKKNKYDDKNKGKTSGRPPIMAVIAILILLSPALTAQETSRRFTLDQIQEMAVQNNRSLKIKQMQIKEKEQKIKEDKVMLFPSVNVGSSYMYSESLPKLTVGKGAFGELPMQYILDDGSIQNVTVSLPNENTTYEMGKHNMFNTGVNVSKTDLAISKEEQRKTTMQIKQAAEKLYYGLLILEKQKEEAELKKQAAGEKLNEAESAVSAGKATASAQLGLNASLADEEQNLLKINIQIDDYTADLKRLTGISDSVTFILDKPAVNDHMLLPVADSMSILALRENTDLKIANLTLANAKYAIKASKLSYIPDLGIFGGYSYQKGNSLFPENNTFIGIAFRWNIQDAFSNSYVKKQRDWRKMQAEENIINIREQIDVDVAKSYRRLSQYADLISVARKAVNYRKEELKVEADKQSSGLNNSSDYLTAKASLAKAEADLYAAQLNYRMAQTDLQILAGIY